MYIFNCVNFHLSCFLKQFYVAKHICTLYNYKYIVYLDSTLKAIVPHICKAITENHVSERDHKIRPSFNTVQYSSYMYK